MADNDNQMFHIGMKGSVLAIDLATGQMLWRTNLKGSGFVNICLQAGLIIAATGGELFCLEPTTGRLIWNNGLAGMGYGITTFAGSDNAAAIARFIEEAQAAAAAAASSTPAT